MENPKTKELRQKYERAVASGATTDSMAGWMNAQSKKGLKSKMAGRIEKRIEEESKKPTYGEIIKAISQARADIEKYKDQPDKLVQAQRKKANEEFDDLVDNNLYSETDRALWVAGRIDEYLNSEEYRNAKDLFRDATNRYSKGVALKEEWEQENADIIEAERVRSKREELLSADPEALRALGITPPPEVEEDHSTTQRDIELEENIEALRSIHPSATDAELRKLANRIKEDYKSGRMAV